MKKHFLLILLFFIGLAISAINPHDYFTWMLEVLPAIIGLIILLFTFKSFKFSYLTYIFILIHCWIKEAFGQSRNNYEKVGHFIQGLVPAMIARELFVRKEVVKKGTWLSFLTVCTCVTISVL